MCMLLLGCGQTDCSGTPLDGKAHVPQFTFVKQESLTCLCCRAFGHVMALPGQCQSPAAGSPGYMSKQCCNISSTTVSGCVHRVCALRCSRGQQSDGMVCLLQQGENTQAAGWDLWEAVPIDTGCWLGVTGEFCSPSCCCIDANATQSPVSQPGARRERQGWMESVSGQQLLIMPYLGI